MRILTLSLAAAVALSFLTVNAEPAQAVGLCAYDDIYNNMGGPGSECQGVVCMGYNSQTGWQTCVPPGPCGVSCLATGTTASSSDLGTDASQQMAICVIGDLYNTGGSPCEGAVCTGWNQWGWQKCYPDFGCWPECGTGRL